MGQEVATCGASNELRISHFRSLSHTHAHPPPHLPTRHFFFFGLWRGFFFPSHPRRKWVTTHRLILTNRFYSSGFFFYKFSPTVFDWLSFFSSRRECCIYIHPLGSSEQYSLLICLRLSNAHHHWEKRKKKHTNCVMWWFVFIRRAYR